MTKLGEVYRIQDMPKSYFTSIDLMEVGDLSETQAFEIMKYLEVCGFGVVYTQTDDEADSQAIDCLYTQGTHLVNRTGVYAFIKGTKTKKR